EFSPVTICFAISQFLLNSAATSQILNRLHCSRAEARPLHPGKTLRAGALSYNNCASLLAGTGGPGGAAQLRQNLFLAKDEVLFVFDLDFRTAVLAKEDAVARLDVEWDQFTLLALSGTDSDDFALHGLLFRGVRDDDATLDRFLLFNTLHDDTVVERGQMHCHLGKPP